MSARNSRLQTRPGQPQFLTAEARINQLRQFRSIIIPHNPKSGEMIRHAAMMRRRHALLRAELRPIDLIPFRTRTSIIYHLTLRTLERAGSVVVTAPRTSNLLRVVLRL